MEQRDEELSVIGFRIGAEEYALALEQVREVITLPRITRVPRAPAHIKGVINLHGNVIPVFDIALRLGIGEARIGPDSRIVVVESGDLVGILAEGVSKVTRLGAADVQPPPPLVAGISAGYLDGVARLPGRFLVFLDLEATLGDA